jgi:hypothetical protein
MPLDNLFQFSFSSIFSYVASTEAHSSTARVEKVARIRPMRTRAGYIIRHGNSAAQEPDTSAARHPRRAFFISEAVNHRADINLIRYRKSRRETAKCFSCVMHTKRQHAFLCGWVKTRAKAAMACLFASAERCV